MHPPAHTASTCGSPVNMNLNHVLPVIIMVWALSRESNDSRTGVKLWNHVESVNYHTIKSVKIMAIADGSAEIWCICTLCTVNWHSQLPPNCCVHTELFPLQLSARNATHCFGNIRCSVARDRLQHCMQIISSGSWHKCQRIPSRRGQPQIGSGIAPEENKECMVGTQSLWVITTNP